MGRAPLTNNETVVHYQYLVKINGKPVGTLQRFNPSTERDLERVREINSSIDRDAVEIIPGRSAHQITVDRLELNTNALAQVLGDESIVSIADIQVPIDIVEIMTKPDGTTRKIHYSKCWPKSYSKTITVDTVSVTESVTFWVTNIYSGGND